MLTLYLSCLVVGGVFVGLSALGAVGEDVDADADVDADLEVDHDLEALTEAGDKDFEAEHALTVADASHGLGRKLWLPMLSFRFWTFGSAFFGLTGALLTNFTSVGALMVAVMSGATGVGVGTVSAWMVRWLRRPVGESIRLGDYVGRSGELELPLREGGVTKVRLRVQGRARTMLAVAPEPRALPSGTRVLVLGIDEDGRAQIEPEQTLFSTEE
jgi:hypothetical protein